MPSDKKGRGRPKIHDDGAILDSALRVFAIHGYEGMSMRSLNQELGLSHGTINQRFGTKEQLYLEAVDHGFRGLLHDLNDIIAKEDMPEDPLEEVRVRLRSFLLASSLRPHLNRLINNEGVDRSPMLDHIFASYIEPGMRATRRLLRQLADQGVVHPLTDRNLLFLLANGAGSAFSLPGLAKKFDRSDGAIDTWAYCDEMSSFIVNGLLVHPPRTAQRPARAAKRSAKRSST